MHAKIRRKDEQLKLIMGLFCINLKKMVEFVEKLLYNKDKLNKSMRNNGKVLA